MRNKASRKNRNTVTIQPVIEEDLKPTPQHIYNKPLPKTLNHQAYHDALADESKHIVLCTGWAGTGKSIVACWYAARALRNEKVSKIVLVRSLEGVGKNPGAYPGTSFEKNYPKLTQYLKYISDFMECSIEFLIESGKIEIVGLYDVQGIDLTDSYLMVTEAQTITAPEMYILVTRGASKLILEGDTLAEGQCTNSNIAFGKDGLSYLIANLSDTSFTSIVRLDDEKDIVRTGYMKEIILRLMKRS